MASDTRYASFSMPCILMWCWFFQDLLMMTNVVAEAAAGARRPRGNQQRHGTWHDLQSINIHDHTRRLLRNNLTNEETKNSWAGLQWFQATRHLSRYEYAYRTRHDLDLRIGWTGLYNETQKDTHESSLPLQSTHSSDRWHKFAKHMDHHDYNHHRQLLNMSAWMSNAGHVDHYQSVPLSQGYGTHLANVWVGSPHPQRKTVIVDTGSHFTAFPCQGCNNCGAVYHTDPYFDPLKSDTFHQLECDECIGVVCDAGRCLFSQSYTEGSSWDAIQVRDLLYCGGVDVLDAVEPNDQKYAVEFMFGCMTTVNGLFLTQLADGIMGMSAHEATLPKQLWNNGILEHNMFAMCFRRELGTSKRGVPAGAMTLGGVSTNLDSSPIVYAKNMAKSGWFTVYVKNIFVRAGGGQSASPTPNTRTVRVNVDLAALNSGKGVIVDSGTTDTYLNKAVAPAFRRAWKVATGGPYSHFPMRLTDEELSRLPTVLVQCHAYATVDPALGDYNSIPGYAGSLDPSSPNDLLIAIPATSYMDFSPITKMYTSRLYLTETSGGVLGSNTMQGHNVVFDWRLGRIGFAESSCTYDKRDSPAYVAEEDGYPADCHVNGPILTQPCLESLDLSVCETHPLNAVVLGTEKFTALVESPGTPSGLTCQETAASDLSDESRMVVCRGDGVCEEERPCELRCTEVKRASEVKAKLEDNEKLGCGDSYWSACDRMCRQTRLYSVAYSDGLCHEISRQSRACHVGVCMRESPCLVPYLVHVVMGFHGLAIHNWTYAADDILSQALVRTSSKLLGDDIFDDGDVNVVFSLPWYLDEDNPEAALHHKSDDEVKPVGVKVVVDISLVNRNYNKTLSLPTPGPFTWVNRTIQDGYGLRCREEDLHRLARLALRLKKEVLESSDFMPSLVREMKQLEKKDKKRTTYFTPLHASTVQRDQAQHQSNQSRLIAAWSVPTGVDEEINYYGPHRPIWYIFVRMLHVGTIFLMLVMLIWSLGGASSSLRELLLRCGWRQWRRPRYSHLVTTNNDLTMSSEDLPEGFVTLELAMQRPRNIRNGPVVKRKGNHIQSPQSSFSLS